MAEVGSGPFWVCEREEHSSGLPELWVWKASRRRADQEDRRVPEEHATVGARNTRLEGRGRAGRD